MHRSPLQKPCQLSPGFPAPRLKNGAFSLIEVTLAIGIIAFAFVALFSLLPIGLQTMRQSIDTASQAWIMQGLNSMVQTTEWEKIYPVSADGITGDVYFYDEEARLTDTEKAPSSDTAIKARRLYAVRLFITPLKQPGTTDSITRDGKNPVLVQVIAAMARMPDPNVVPEALKSLTVTSVSDLERGSNIRVGSFVATQMNAAR